MFSMRHVSRRHALSIFGVAAAGGFSGAAVATRTGKAASRAARAVSDPKAVHPGPEQLLWRRQVGTGADMNVVAADGMIYASSGVRADGDSVTYAIEAATGRLAWQAAGCYPAAAGGDAVFGFEIAGDVTSVIALSAATGRTAWSYAAGPYLGYTQDGWIAYARGMVYIASGTTKLAVELQPTVRALDARTGRLAWSAALSNAVQWPAMADGILYGCSEGRVVALHMATGARLWESAYIDGVISALDCADGTVCVDGVDASTGATSLITFDGTSGRQLWRNGSGDLTAAAGGMILLTAWGSTSNTVSAYHARSGKLTWARSLGQFGPLTATGDVLYVCNGPVLTALAAISGATLWTYRLDHEVWWVVGNGSVVFACDAKGSIYALDSRL
jgi:outer membrane protein assembly factor BamB